MMKRLDASDFLREVLADLDDLPPGLANQLVALVESAPSTRSNRIRNAIDEATRD